MSSSSSSINPVDLSRLIAPLTEISGGFAAIASKILPLKEIKELKLDGKTGEFTISLNNKTKRKVAFTTSKQKIINATLTFNKTIKGLIDQRNNSIRFDDGCVSGGKMGISGNLKKLEFLKGNDDFGRLQFTAASESTGYKVWKFLSGKVESEITGSISIFKLLTQMKIT